MLVNRAELLQKLDTVAPGLATRETVEQSSCFVFRNNTLLTYNGDLACWLRCEMGGLRAAVAAEPLRQLLTKLAEEEVDINAGEGELLVKAGKGRESGIRMEAEITLPIKAVERPTEWVALHDDFNEAVEICIECTTKDTGSGFYKACVHLHPKWVEACDNFQMARYPLATGVAASTLVKREVIRHIKQLGMTEMSETPTWLHFRSPVGLILSCRRYVGEEADFPDLTAVLKTRGTPASLPGGLAEAVDKAQVFTGEAEVENVMIELRPGKLRITGRGSSGWYRESRSIKYEGETIAFLIAPKLLTELTKRHTECEIAPGRLRVDGGRFIYITCLAPVQEAAHAAKQPADNPE